MGYVRPVGSFRNLDCLTIVDTSEVPIGDQVTIGDAVRRMSRELLIERNAVQNPIKEAPVERVTLDLQVARGSMTTGTLIDIRLASDLKSLSSAIVSNTRRLLRCDGVSFIVKDNDYCFYVKEDACDPLWMGQRFPVRRCVAGYAILDGQPIAIPDIELDYRVPLEAYKRTFVRSSLIVPVISNISKSGLAAIECYWKEQGRKIENNEVQTLQSIADATTEAFSRLALDTESAKSLPAEAQLDVHSARLHKVEIETANTIINVEHLGERVDELKTTVHNGFKRIDVKLDSLDATRDDMVPRFLAIEKEVGIGKERRNKLWSALGSLALIALGGLATKFGEVIVSYITSLFK